jgi:hypothetical protein
MGHFLKHINDMNHLAWIRGELSYNQTDKANTVRKANLAAGFGRRYKDEPRKNQYHHHPKVIE